MHTCMFCIPALQDITTRVCMNMYEYMYVCIYIYMNMCMYVCIYICIYT